jgi:lipopolysaccharide assembly outer membrane protein LptD (OstA)
VQINGTLPDNKPSYSDLLAATTIQMFRGYYLDAGIQWNPDQDRVNYSNVAFAWRPESRKLLNVGYRYRRPTSVTDNTAIDQFEMSGQWPITQRTYGIGRVAFDSRPTSSWMRWPAWNTRPIAGWAVSSTSASATPRTDTPAGSLCRWNSAGCRKWVPTR